MAEFWRSTTTPHLEIRRSCRENTCYRLHTHDAFSIGLIDEGTSLFSGRLDGTIRLVPGDVILIPAGHVHACNPEQGRWLYQMLHIDQDWAASLSPRGPAGAMFAGISVLRQPGCYHRTRILSDMIVAGAEYEEIETGFAALFGEFETAPPAHVAATETDDHLLQQLLPVMDRLGHDESNPALSELAELVGMSKYQLVRAMRRATGLTPLAWRRNARIIQARHLLREGVPIAETAHTLGFTDQSHFHRVFHAHVATSPGAYTR